MVHVLFLGFNSSYHAIVVLAIAAFLDYLIGDPWQWPHPVRVMGWIITHYTQWVFNLYRDISLNSIRPMLRGAGILLTILLVVGSGLLGWFVIQAANQLHPIGGMIIESILLASCFAAHSLRDAAEDVLQPFMGGDFIKARQQLSLYVGRDTAHLSEAEILRAVLETVTENATDGVMAPLFYALLGAAIPGLGSVPLALAYKAASTLDSMVGYRDPPYTDLGWFSAKLEDILTWLPCRFMVITIALLSGQPHSILKICQRDAIQDPSPNAGWSECAYAALLGVQMGGINQYGGVTKQKPLLGDLIHPITPDKIHQALQITRHCFLIWLGLFILIKIGI